MNEQLLDRDLRDVFAHGPRSVPKGTVERALARAAVLPQRRPRFARLDRGAWPPVRQSASDPAIHRAVRTLALAGLLVLLGGIIAVGARLLDRPPLVTLETGATLDAVVTDPRATLWPDGRVLIQGSDATAYLFDPANGTTTLARLGREMGANPSVHVLPDGRIVLITALDPSMVIGRRVGFLDPVSADVDVVGELPPYVFQQSELVLRDGRVLMSGGVAFPLAQPPCSPTVCEGGATPVPTQGRPEGLFDNVSLFDPATGATTSLAPLRQGRFQHSMLELDDGRILIVGGFGISEALDVEIYDLATGTSTIVGSISPRRSLGPLPPVRLTDGRVLIQGGTTLEEPCGSPAPQTDQPAHLPSVHAIYRQETHVFDPSTNAMVDGPVLPHAMGFASIAALPDGRAVMFGQYTATPAGCASTEDPYTKSWLGVIDIHAGRVYETYDPRTGVSSLPIDPPHVYDASVLLPDGRLALIGNVNDDPRKNPIDLVTIGP